MEYQIKLTTSFPSKKHIGTELKELGVLKSMTVYHISYLLLSLLYLIQCLRKSHQGVKTVNGKRRKAGKHIYNDVKSS